MLRRFWLLLGACALTSGLMMAVTPPAARLPTPAPTSPVAAGDATDMTQLDDPARLAAAAPIARDPEGLMRAFRKLDAAPKVVRTTPLSVTVGMIETFWVGDEVAHTHYTVTARLRYAGPAALMYVDTTLTVDQAAVERSAKTFEQQIYPRNRALFGHEPSPGIDGDPRITILNTTVKGAGGYFSAADQVSKAVNRFSNERDMFVIGVDSYPLGSDAYASILAHEFQHMIHWQQQRRSPSWFNEGLSTLAEDLNGYAGDETAHVALANPDVPLLGWSRDAAITGEHYGTARLFLRYFLEQYGDEHTLAELIRADAGNHPEVFARIAARKRPAITSFARLYADWAVANILNDGAIEDGRYAYQGLPSYAALSELQAGTVITTVNQFAADYLGVIAGPRTLVFDGAPMVGVSGKRMWWSGRGDDSVATLTRAFDLRGLDHATLHFATWYELEHNFDYAFVSVSADEGATWTTLQGTTTTTADPQGQNFGHGLTGVSGVPGREPGAGTRARWVAEQMDLTPFAGQRVLLRFWVVNDSAYNAQGLLIDDIRVPELHYADDGEHGSGGWATQGFVQTTGRLAQQWTLRLAHVADGALRVDDVPVDHAGHATIHVADGEQAVLVVMGITPITSEPATYTYRLGGP